MHTKRHTPTDSDWGAEAKASVQLANAVKERLGGGSWEGLFEEVGKPVRNLLPAVLHACALRSN